MEKAVMRLIKRFADLAFEIAVIRPFLEFATGKNGQGGIGGFLAGLFAPRDAGGNVNAGGTYRINERGMEMLQMGGAGGRIIPLGAGMNSSGGGGAVNLTIGFDAETLAPYVKRVSGQAANVRVQQLAQQVPSMAQAAVAQGRMNRTPGLV
jgi:hypothetical protein